MHDDFLIYGCVCHYFVGLVIGSTPLRSWQPTGSSIGQVWMVPGAGGRKSCVFLVFNLAGGICALNFAFRIKISPYIYHTTRHFLTIFVRSIRIACLFYIGHMHIGQLQAPLSQMAILRLPIWPQSQSRKVGHYSYDVLLGPTGLFSGLSKSIRLGVLLTFSKIPSSIFSTCTCQEEKVFNPWVQMLSMSKISTNSLQSLVAKIKSLFCPYNPIIHAIDESCNFAQSIRCIEINTRGRSIAPGDFSLVIISRGFISTPATAVHTRTFGQLDCQMTQMQSTKSWDNLCRILQQRNRTDWPLLSTISLYLYLH